MCRHDPSLTAARARPAPPKRATHGGRQRHYSGASAEEQVARFYERNGGEVEDKRARTPEGEIDLVTRIDDILVFVEVKKRKNLSSFDAPITNRQWRRLENAALHYMMTSQNETGVQPVCRFDVALVGPDGSIQIIENARSFDDY